MQQKEEQSPLPVAVGDRVFVRHYDRSVGNDVREIVISQVGPDWIAPEEGGRVYAMHDVIRIVGSSVTTAPIYTHSCGHYPLEQPQVGHRERVMSTICPPCQTAAGKDAAVDELIAKLEELLRKWHNR